jgi:Ca2+-binding EF-hand superfamily protein
MSFIPRCLVAGAILALAGASGSAAPPKKSPPREYLPPTLSWLREVESVQMLTAILSGTPPASGNMGWFHPGQSEHGLKWLLQRMDTNNDGAVSKDEFTGAAELFDRLDRDHDGRLTAADFDWSDDGVINKQMRTVNALFSRADADHDEKLTAAEWQEMFKQAAKGKSSLSREELHALLFPPLTPSPSPQRGEGRGRKPGAGMPTPLMLLKGLFEGEIGSLCEGPKVGQLAPDFTLPKHDEDKNITLSQFRGNKPVVLIFGSFT